MSITPEVDNTENAIDLADVLTKILIELKLLNARLEEGIDTGIELEDIDDDNC